METFFPLDGTLPLILAEIVLNTLQWHKFPEVVEPTEDEKAQAVCVWRNLEMDFHDDQLNPCSYYEGFDDCMRQMDIGLLCRGHLSVKEARIIAHLVRNMVVEGGDVHRAHDIRTSYITLFRGNQLARYVFSTRPAPRSPSRPH